MTQIKTPAWKKIWPWVGTGFMALLILTLVIVLCVRGCTAENKKEDDGTQNSVREDPLPPPAQNVFTPEDFEYRDGYLTCTADQSRLGVDVSHFQGEIDWEAVKNAGMTFAIIRVAGRGYGTAGTLYDDKYAAANYQGAKAAGLDVGVYFFSQATSVSEAREEAAYVLSATKDWELDMPVVFDWEYIGEEARTARVDPRTLTDCMLAFCEQVEAAGREAMVYFNPDHSESMFHIEELTEYDFWLAMYTDWMDYPYKVDMWQYTCTGSVPGIEGNVDINLFFPYDNEA